MMTGRSAPHVTTWGRLDATTRFRGFVTAEDFLRAACEISAHPRFETAAFFVADFLDIEGHAIDLPAVREDLAAQALGGQVSNSRYRIVVVANDPGIDAFTEKMRALYAGGGPEIVTFRSRGAAAVWMAQQEVPPNERDTQY